MSPDDGFSWHVCQRKGAKTEQYPCNTSYHNSCDNTSTSDHTRAMTMMDGITVRYQAIFFLTPMWPWKEAMPKCNYHCLWNVWEWIQIILLPVAVNTYCMWAKPGSSMDCHNLFLLAYWQLLCTRSTVPKSRRIYGALATVLGERLIGESNGYFVNYLVVCFSASNVWRWITCSRMT